MCFYLYVIFICLDIIAQSKPAGNVTPEKRPRLRHRSPGRAAVGGAAVRSKTATQTILRENQKYADVRGWPLCSELPNSQTLRMKGLLCADE